MHSISVEPTIRNIANSISRDTFHRNLEVTQLIHFLNHIEGHYSYAVDDKWGSGKTFFIKETHLTIKYLWTRRHPKASEDWDDNLLEPQDKMQLQVHLADLTQNLDDFNQYGIYYDAWKNDYHSNPLLSLILAITEQTQQDLGSSKIEIADIAGMIFTILGKVMPAPLSGFCGAAAQVVNQADKITGTDILNFVKNEKELNRRIHEFFESLSEALNASRIVIFIDELDRCQPGFAVRLLEQIKHYCLIDNITFVFSINSDQLQYTIKHFYGEQIDGLRYLDKMFDAREPLREISRFEQLKMDCHDSAEYYSMLLNAIGHYFQLSIREFEKFQNAMEMLIADLYRHGLAYIDGELIICARFFAPILYALRMVDINSYNDFVNGYGEDCLRKLIIKNPDILLVLRMTMPMIAKKDQNHGVNDDELVDNLVGIYKGIFANPYNQWVKVSGISVCGSYKEQILNKTSLEKKDD